MSKCAFGCLILVCMGQVLRTVVRIKQTTIDLVYSQSLAAKELVQIAVGSDTLCTDTDIGSTELFT